MNRIFLSFLICISTCACLPLELNFELVNICSDGFFEFEHKLVNSFYRLNFTHEFIAQWRLIYPDLDLNYFDPPIAANLNNIQRLYHEELNSIFDEKEFMNPAKFKDRNLNVKITHFQQLLKGLLMYKRPHTDVDDQKILKVAIDKTNSTIFHLAYDLLKYQTEFLPDIPKDNSTYESFMKLEINNQTEECVFPREPKFKDVLYHHGIFRVEGFELNKNPTNLLHFSLYIPFSNKNYDSYQCVNYKKLPLFYRTKGTDHPSDDISFANEENVMV